MKILVIKLAPFKIKYYIVISNLDILNKIKVHRNEIKSGKYCYFG